MHDDESLTLGRAERVLTERIRPAVHAQSRAFGLTAHQLPGEPIPPAEGLALDYAEVEPCLRWGPAWSTTWFRLRGSVPEEWAGEQVEAVIDLGFDDGRAGFQCEGLIYYPDGTPLKALNPQNQHAVLLDSAAGGEDIELYVEAAANPEFIGELGFRPTLAGDILTSSPDPLYAVRRTDLAVFDAEVHALMLDVEVLLGLARELPGSPRRDQILQALDDALDALDLQDISGTAGFTRSRLASVLSSPAEASAHTVSAIGHAHIDSAWLWPIRETVRKVARTTTSMAELIERTAPVDAPEGPVADSEDPTRSDAGAFRYGMSSAQQYAWLKEHRPEVWERVVEAVRSGRFLPLGGMWVESDVVMPSGEALIRQFLYGQRFFEAEFGIRCRGVWLPDSFGYSPALPQLMKRAGFEWFFTQKISWNQVNKFPHHTFEWEGIDGSRILSHFSPMDTYNSELSGAELGLATRQFRESRRAGSSIAPVGYGDGGGGTTREMVGRAERLADLEGSPKVRWEHPDDFYARTREELTDPPVWVGELYLEIHRATLTSQHKTKQGNRRSESLMVEAELWATTAALRAGLEYPYEAIDELWQSVLLHQFHDILPGSSIAWVHREAQDVYASIQQRAEDLIKRSLSALTGSGTTVLQANPAPTVEAGVPALGIAITPEGTSPAVVCRKVDDGGYVLENDLVTVQLSAEGHLVSAVERSSGRDAVPEGREAGVLQIHQDFPNKWDAWDVDRFYRNTVTDLREVSSLSTETSSDGTASVLVTRPLPGGHSYVEQRISLEPGSRMLTYDQRTQWQESEKFLKASFPLDIRADNTIAETQFGHFKRPTHANTSWEAAKFETSMHRFVLAEEPGFGVALVNDSTYGYDVSRAVEDADVVTTLRISLLRAPRFPDPTTDQGTQTHTYGLVIGADVAEATRAGIALNQPVRTVTGAAGAEPLVGCEGAGILVSSVKLAADRSGDLIVRVYESLGRRASGSVGVNVPVTAAREVSLIEDDLSAGTLALDGGQVAISLKPFEVRTLRFTTP